MKKIILAAALVGFAVVGFAQKRKSNFPTGDFMVVNDANLKTPMTANSPVAKLKFKTPAKETLQGEYQLQDGAKMKWVLLYDKSSRTVAAISLDHSTQNAATFVSQPLPANFWAKASETFIKNDEANQKLSIEALLRQAYK